LPNPESPDGYCPAPKKGKNGDKSYIHGQSGRAQGAYFQDVEAGSGKEERRHGGKNDSYKRSGFIGDKFGVVKVGQVKDKQND